MKINRLMVLEEMFHRDLLGKNSDEAKEYFRLRAGLDGELELMAWLQARIKNNDAIIHDLSINYYGQTQIDILVMWDYYWWVIEVKNYDGIFIVTNHSNTLREWKMPVDQFAAMRNRLNIVKQAAKSIDARIMVQGSFILIHPDGEIQTDKSEEFEVLTRPQINRAISRQLEQNYQYTEQKIVHDMERLGDYVKSFPQHLPEMTSLMWQQCKKGVKCPKCDHFMVEQSQKFLKCPACYFSNFKRYFALDLVRQLSILFHNQKDFISTQHLVEFSAGLMSKKVFYSLIGKHLECKSAGRYRYFELKE